MAHFSSLASCKPAEGLFSVDSVTVTEFYSEKESERPPRVEGRVCVCTVCVYGGRCRVGTVSPEQRPIRVVSLCPLPNLAVELSTILGNCNYQILIISVFPVTLGGYPLCISVSPSAKMGITITSVS